MCVPAAIAASCDDAGLRERGRKLYTCGAGDPGARDISRSGDSCGRAPREGFEILEIGTEFWYFWSLRVS